MTENLSTWLPGTFTEWMPITQALTLGLATFVQEDTPTVTAALLAGAGRLNWSAGFLGCFLGIWLGDMLLYWLARAFGRPLLRHAWAQRFASPESIARSEDWFSQQGTWVLVSSRFVPGTRLPTYLAAGFLRLSFPRFLLVTGSVVAVWTVGIFGLAHLLGARLSEVFHRWNGIRGLILILVPALLAVRFGPRLFHADARRRWRTSFGRWSRWEFWPAWLFYLPVGFQYVRLAVRYRSLTLPSAANPGITTGGLVGESKFETLQELFRTSPEFTAEAWLIAGGNSPERWTQVQRQITEQCISYPFILKPDLGQRGLGVKLIRNEDAAIEYLKQNRSPLVLQRYVPGPLEVGVFYYRFPQEGRGRVFAVTEKIFPTLTGDGVHSIEELIWRDERARFMAAQYFRRFDTRRNEILPDGEALRLVEAGNHAQGCIFRDGAHLLSPELEARIDEISRALPGFFIGRFDLRFETVDDLRAGRNFRILELNGAAAEATSIYDARNSLASAYATLFRQWALVFAIGAANRARGVVPTSPRELVRIWRAANALFGGYPVAD